MERVSRDFLCRGRPSFECVGPPRLYPPAPCGRQAAARVRRSARPGGAGARVSARRRLGRPGWRNAAVDRNRQSGAVRNGRSFWRGRTHHVAGKL